MSFFFDFIGWVAVNILVPTLAPIIFLLLPKIPRKTRPFSKGLVLRAVQDGQLFWVTIALCAVGCYELYTYIEAGAKGFGHAGAIGGIVVFSICIIVSMVLVVLQAIDIPMPSNAPPAVQSHDSGLVKTSVWFVLVISVMVCGSHYLAANESESAILASKEKQQALITCLKDTKRRTTCPDEGAKK
jgi:cellobiose-specific phosphotransferase system component IIC